MFSGRSENDVLIYIVQQILADLLSLQLAALQLGQQFLGLHVPLLGVQHLLEPEEVLPGLLVQFLVDVSIDPDEFGDDHVFQGVDSAVGHLDLLVEGEEGGLQGCDSYEHVQNGPELLSAFLDGEASSLQADLAHRVVCVLALLEVEVGYEHACDVLL